MFVSIRRAATAVLVLLFAVAGTALWAVAQDADPVTAEPAQAAAAPVDAQETPYEVPMPSLRTQPEAAQPPRTLRAYWHLFIAFAVTWLLLFGYAVSVGRRWARLEREVQALKLE